VDNPQSKRLASLCIFVALLARPSLGYAFEPTNSGLDHLFRGSASSTFVSVLSHRLFEDPEMLSAMLSTSPASRASRRERLDELKEDPLLELDPEEVVFATTLDRSRPPAQAAQALDFATAVRKRLGASEDLTCRLVEHPTTIMLHDSRMTFSLLMREAGDVAAVKQLLLRPSAPLPYEFGWDQDVAYGIATGLPLEEILPGGSWLASIADDVGSLLFSCSGATAKETQLLLLRAILKSADLIAAARGAYESQECSLYPVNKSLYPANKFNAAALPCSRPRICLALSGGGVRSAAFHVGVLQALYERDLLDKVDIISAVSGGAYAAGWLINQRLAETPSPHASPYSFLNNSQLQESDKARAQLLTLSEGGVSALLGVLVAPLHWIRDQTARAEPGKPTFFTQHYLYVDLLSLAIPSPKIHFAQLEIALRDIPDVPFPIFAATAHQGPCLDDELPAIGDSKDLERSVFEFSAAGVGSMQRGLDKVARAHFTVADAVGISGAAPDMVSGRVACSLRKTLQIRVGARLDDLLLTDGGFSDNLAVFPLVRRNCDVIVVSDAEYDKEMVFDSYQKLRAGLAKQEATTVSIPELDDHLAKSTRLCDKSFDADLKEPCFVAPIRPRHDVLAARRQEKTWFGGTLLPAAAARPTQLIYLKLGLDENSRAVANQPEILEALKWNCPVKNCSFPQIPTETMQYLPPQISTALRKLGALSIDQAVSENLNHFNSVQSHRSK
jgi:predicted acylesterase/phospholipase RssA